MLSPLYRGETRGATLSNACGQIVNEIHIDLALNASSISTTMLQCFPKIVFF